MRNLRRQTLLLGIDEVMEVGVKPLVAVVMIAFDSCFLDRAIHPCDLDRWSRGIVK